MSEPWWFVVTPKFVYTEPLLDDGTGPTYDVCDVVEVQASTASEAKAAGVKAMLADSSYQYVHDQRRDGASPYTGVRAERMACHHGVDLTPQKQEPWQECPACADELAAQERSGWCDA